MPARTVRFSRSRAVARTLVVTEGCGAVIAALVIVVSLVQGRPVPHVGVLVVPAIPLLVVGQLWAILRMRERGVTRRTRPRGWLLIPWSGNPVRFFFGNSHSTVGKVLLTAAIGGWLAAVTAFPALAQGDPSGQSDGCPYQLANHGTVKCVTRTVYEHAGADSQRLAAGLLLSFFCIHVGVALGALAAASPGQRRGR